MGARALEIVCLRRRSYQSVSNACYFPQLQLAPVTMGCGMSSPEEGGGGGGGGGGWKGGVSPSHQLRNYDFVRYIPV